MSKRVGNVAKKNFVSFTNEGKFELTDTSGISGFSIVDDAWSRETIIFIIFFFFLFRLENYKIDAYAYTHAKKKKKKKKRNTELLACRCLYI